MSDRISTVRVPRIVLAVFAAATFIVSGFFVPSVAAASPVGISSIIITTPTAGVLWRGTQNITWNAVGAGSGDTVDIVYTTDNFAHKLVAGQITATIGTFAWNTSALPDSSTYQIQIADHTRPLVNTVSSVFTVDNTPPTTSLTIPANDGTNGWYKTVPTITLGCVDAGGSVCGSTYYSWDGGSTTVYIGAFSASEGTHTLSYWSEDTAVDKDTHHNVETAHSLVVKVDTIAPTISGYTLNGGTSSVVFNPNHASVVIGITASELVKFNRIHVCSDGDATCSDTTDIKSFDTTTFGVSASKSWNGRNGSGVIAPDGLYKLKVSIVDQAGNSLITELSPQKMTVDTVNPTVSVPTSPVADTVYRSDTDPTPAITFTASDPVPGTDISCTYRIDALTPVSVPCTGGTLTGLTDGRHSVVVTATDAANNSKSSDPISFVFDDNNTLTVGPIPANDFATIQAAVDAAALHPSITTVAVTPGTYNESVLIGKTLTLAGSGTKPVIAGAVGHNYILKIDGANGVLVNNVEINGGGSGVDANAFDYGILVNNSGTSTVPTEIENSTIRNIWSNGSNGVGVEGSSYAQVHNNTISSFHKRGIRFIDSIGTFYSNEVIGDHVDGTTRVQNLVTLWGGSNVEIYGNTLHDGMSTTPGSWNSPAVFVSSYGGSSASTANIHDNTIYNVDTGVTVGSAYAPGDTSAVIIRNNNIHDTNAAVNFEENTATATITLNQFTNVTIGVGADDGSGIPLVMPTIDAVHNWWGSEEGPIVASNPYGAGARVIDAVDYVSWCTDPACSPLDDAAPTATFVPSSLPHNLANITTTNIAVGPAEVVYYEYSLDGAAWSLETPVATHITLSGLLDGPHALSVIGRDQAGNWQSVPLTPTFTWTVDTVAPVLSTVSISSNNALNTALAKVGDTATLVFTSSEEIAPTVTIDGQGAVVAGGPTAWIATYAFVGGETEGTIPFSIASIDLAGNPGVTVTGAGDGSSVFYDRTAPEVEAGANKEVNSVVSQDATVSDPAPASDVNTYTWSQQSGPVGGTVTFSNPNGIGDSVDTDLSANVDGTYVLRLTVTDNAGNVASDEMTFIWDTTRPEPLTSSPSNGTTGVALAAGTATVTYDEPIALLDFSRVLLVNDATNTSYEGTVAVSSNPAILSIAYSGLDYGTKYRINVKPNALRDIAGNHVATNFISYFTTAIDTVPPVVNFFGVAGVTDSGATLNVTTNEAATCHYSATDSAFGSMTPMDTTGTTDHSQALTGLSPSTTYSYYVRCADISAQANTMTTSANVSFTTRPPAPIPDTTAPAIPAITTVSATVDADTYTIAGIVAVDADALIVSIYNGATLAGTVSVPAGQIAWAILAPLTQDTANSFTATAADEVGNISGPSTPTIITEATAVGDIEAPPAPAITTTDDAVDADTYTLTGTAGADTPTDGTRVITIVRNGTVVGSLSLPAGETDWSFVVPLLQNAGNAFSATSTDVAGMVSGASSEVVIIERTAEPAPDTTAPLLTNIQTVSISSVSATINWNTDEPSTSQVEYGATSDYGYSTTEDTAKVTTHSVSLSGLTPGITYHFRVRSADEAPTPNLATSDDQTFATSPATPAPAVAGVTRITAVKTSAIADGEWAHGWEWVFEATLPMEESSVSMKFGDWVSGANSIPAANNIRFFSAQASNANSVESAITIGAANTYTGPMMMTSDLDPAQAGRQIRITVQVKVPVGSAGGSYSTSYGIKSTAPAI